MLKKCATDCICWMIFQYMCFHAVCRDYLGRQVSGLNSSLQSLVDAFASLKLADCQLRLISLYDIM